MADIIPGSICHEGDAQADARFLALSAVGGDGHVRCVPLLAGVIPSDARPLQLKKDDADCTVEGSWLRMDRAGWRSATGLSPLGSATRSLLARVHRELAKGEARAFAQTVVEPAFKPGTTPIPPSGKVIGAPEFEHLIDASLDGWLTTGRFNDLFQQQLGTFLGRKHVLTTNSGSSANLLALSALTSPLLGDRAMQPGDEVITVAAGFPTTVNPILQNGLVPVFVDVALPTYNIDVSRIEAAISPRTRAIMIAHTLGNPFDLDAVMRIVERHGLWLVEDCCDALGSTYQGRKVGTFGHVGTLSFYPAHHITMGEGGAVFTDDDVLKRAIESIRDWGRDCYCAPGRDNTCGKRFKWQLGQLPQGYDHKYTYSHLGYNLKITDMQAALGVAQLGRLAGFIESRKANFRYLHDKLYAVADRLVLPEATPGSDPSWFGFPLTIRPESELARVQVVRHLNRKRVGTRQLFAGNLLRQPYFAGRPHRVSGGLECSDLVMNNTFWIGLYPGLSEQQLEFSANAVIESARAHA